MDNSLVILGGMGPQASVKLHQLLLEGSVAHHSGSPDEYPAIRHLSIPVPDFISSPKEYVKALGLIKDVCESPLLDRASAVGIACNTAHLMVPDLPLSDLPFVSMIDAVTTKLQEVGAFRVGLLASPQTVKTGLYGSALKHKGLRTVVPSKNELQELDDIIHDVISGTNPALLRPKLSRLALNLEKRGADAILLGCTELPLIGVDSKLVVVDSLQALADRMLEKHYQESCII